MYIQIQSNTKVLASYLEIYQDSTFFQSIGAVFSFWGEQLRQAIPMNLDQICNRAWKMPVLSEEKMYDLLVNTRADLQVRLDSSVNSASTLPRNSTYCKKLQEMR